MLPLDTTPRTLRKLADSRSAEIYTWGNDHVVKLFRLGFPREAIDREVQNAAMIHALRIPTPKPEGTVEIKGRAGIIFERCDGPTVYELIARPDISSSQLAQSFFELQFGIHRCSHPALHLATRTLEDDILRAPVADETKQRALDTARSMPSAAAVCHGDYHPINVLLPRNGPVAVDWLDAGKGDPLYDVARSIVYLRFARPGQVGLESRASFVARYEQCCREAWQHDWERLERWLLPVAVARLASVVDETERRALLTFIEDARAR